MSDTRIHASVDQNATGDNNIQVAGDDNIIQQEITNFIPEESERSSRGQTNRNSVTPASPRKNAPPTANQNISGKNNIQVAGNNNFIQQFISFFKFDSKEQHAQRNRRAMLELVENTWIKGVLEKSLHAEILIELGLEATPGAVERNWDVQVQMPAQENRRLPNGTSLAHVFDALNGSMLILGEPGSGKTTMLLELARDKIARARKHPELHIPVVLNLSSWGVGDVKQSLASWLMTELSVKYYVSSKIANSWIENDGLLLMLDGLDEVRDDLRNECVAAINDFRGQHGLTPMVVCSRVSDYTALSKKLSLQGAVLLQPLTPVQVDEYFERAGPELSAIHKIVQESAVLLELIRQPLMLGIVVLAYRGIPQQAILNRHFHSLDAHRKHLFETYIAQMFRRTARTKNENYSPEQVKKWLSQLAKNITKEGQSIFFLERISPQWLTGSYQYMAYRSLLVLWGTFVAVTTCTILSVLFEIYWVLGLAAGLLCGLFIAAGTTSGKYLKPIEILRWSWKAVGRFMADELITGLIGGLLIGLVFFIFTGAWEGLLMWPIAALILKLIGSVILIANYGLESEDLENRMIPNQGITQSLVNAVAVFFLGGAIVCAVVGLVVSFFSDITNGIIIGLSGGLLFGVIYGINLCGRPVYAHYALRFLLYLSDQMPGDYVHFLNYCVDRIFLRRVGGGYIFVHRLLMEHFAAMYKEE